MFIKNKALFIDRDGVINYDYGYVGGLQNFVFKKNIFNSLKKFQNKNYQIIVISNQAGIAKNKFSLKSYLVLEKYIQKEFNKKQIYIKFFYCPHHINAVLATYKKNCFFRKPNPGMILKASKLYNINLKKSILIGDKISDIKAGLRSGINKNFLLKNIRLKKNKFFKRYDNLDQIFKINFK
jgi:D-glycero-D-manno-heptose 1,7-bisphosphate phosphatase